MNKNTSKGLKKRNIAIFIFLFFLAHSSVAIEPSGTLPVLYVTTQDGAEITSKEDYVAGDYYLVANGCAGFSDIGDSDNRPSLQIRGRGNYTWTNYEKKPFRLKLDKKADLMGTGKSKHYSLLPHCDDYYGYIRDHVGFELSRRMGLAWTPRHEPVELVLNGDYRGIYFLTEQIKIAPNRVNITEQEDMETDPEHITGGWLLEIDNYWDDKQLHVTDSSGEELLINITSHSPEDLSPEQFDYMYSLIYKTDSLIKVDDKTDTAWESAIDMDSLACFYIINELMDNIEAFHGSCWMHKERGENTKLIFGPVWDFGNAFSRGIEEQDFIYNLEGIWKEGYSTTWIKDIALFPRFQECVMRHWNAFFQAGKTDITDFVDHFYETILPAVAANDERWPGLRVNLDYHTEFLRRYQAKTDFLNERWAQNSAIDAIRDKSSGDYHVTDIMGRTLFHGSTLPSTLPPGQILIIHQGDKIIKRITR